LKRPEPETGEEWIEKYGKVAKQHATEEMKHWRERPVDAVVRQWAVGYGMVQGEDESNEAYFDRIKEAMDLLKWAQRYGVLRREGEENKAYLERIREEKKHLTE
jgi:hypothetical protein